MMMKSHIRSVARLHYLNARVSSISVRKFGGGRENERPMSLGPGGKVNEIPSDADQATGREREELKAFAQGVEYFNRKPVQMQEGQGTFENPVMVPSETHVRPVGIVPRGQDQPIWFNLNDKGVHYVQEVDLHFQLFNPHKDKA